VTDVIDDFVAPIEFGKMDGGSLLPVGNTSWRFSHRFKRSLLAGAELGHSDRWRTAIRRGGWREDGKSHGAWAAALPIRRRIAVRVSLTTRLTAGIRKLIYIP